ncbi:hypothetical protein GR7B_00184 [Vibrio phage vB_VcorM_GR7B]|nr:hypothetical protein GR7B_00184 [Vibrio phage vB_VcorM_GR7B]
MANPTKFVDRYFDLTDHQDFMGAVRNHQVAVEATNKLRTDLGCLHNMGNPVYKGRRLLGFLKGDGEVPNYMRVGGGAEDGSQYYVPNTKFKIGKELKEEMSKAEYMTEHKDTPLEVIGLNGWLMMLHHQISRVRHGELAGRYIVIVPETNSTEVNTPKSSCVENEKFEPNQLDIASGMKEIKEEDYQCIVRASRMGVNLSDLAFTPSAIRNFLLGAVENSDYDAVQFLEKVDSRAMNSGNDDEVVNSLIKYIKIFM